MTSLFLVELIGEVTLHFILLHGSKGSSSKLERLLKDFKEAMIPYQLLEPLIEKNKEAFHNWVIFTLNWTHRTDVNKNMFEHSLVAHRRGLSRDGRELLANRGFVMKRTLFDSTLKEVLLKNFDDQK